MTVNIAIDNITILYITITIITGIVPLMPSRR